MFLSIIIPCYNCSTTIERAVASVFLQTHKNWELILVNNNSTDDTWEKLQDIKAKYPEYTITLLDEKKKGAPAARNRGLNLSNGDWIQFLDADDELLPEKISQQIAGKNLGNISFIYSPFVVVALDDNNNERIIKTREIITGDKWEAILRSRMGTTSANLWNKKKLTAISGWDEKLTSSQEYDLMFRLMRNSDNAQYADSIGTKIFLQELSISNQKEPKLILKVIKNYITLRQEIITHLKKDNDNRQKYNSIFADVTSNYYLRYFQELPLQVFFRYNLSGTYGFIDRLKVNYSFFMILFRKYFSTGKK